MSQTYSRRAVLAQIGFGAAAAAAAPVRHAFAQADAIPWYFLTDDEARWIAAIADVFIPEDEFPSASQAGVVDFIDLQMATGYGQGEGLYMQGPFMEGTASQGWQLAVTPAELLRKGLAGVRDLAEADLTRLPPADREAFVQAMSEDKRNYGEVPTKSFFDEMLKLTNQGYFADPIYMGNFAYAGWKMVGFPGAHAYYMSRVDNHDYTFREPPMGIAHRRAGEPGLPRPVGREG